MNYINHKYSLYESEEDIFWVKYSPEGNYIAAAWGDGSIKIIDRKKVEIRQFIANPKLDKFDQMPITCLRWRENDKILSASSADGFIYTWHVKSGKLISKYSEGDNQVYCIDYDRNFTNLATAGKDFKVRIYDEATKSLLSTLERGSEKYSGHSNRIFALKFHPDNGNLLLSGSWDNSIYLWDVRDKKPNQYFSGPNISGESIDVIGNDLLAGSFNDNKNLQIFDLRKENEPIPINWFDSEDSVEDGAVSSWLYSAIYSKPNAGFILAGGANKNEVRIFYAKESNNYKAVSKISKLYTPWLSIDWNNEGNEFAFGLSDGSIHVMALYKV